LNWRAAFGGRARLAAPADGIAGLSPALARLDALLSHLIESAQAHGGVAAAALRGLYVSPAEAAELLARPAGVPRFAPPAGAALKPFADAATRADPLACLADEHGLDDFETDLLLIALAPDIDLRYERIYGFLQDDATRRRATVDLALSLRTASPAEKAARLHHLMPDAPLIAGGLLHLVPDPAQPQLPLLAHALAVDAQIVRQLLGLVCLDPRLAGFCRLLRPAATFEDAALPAESVKALQVIGKKALARSSPLVLHFRGPAGAGQRDAAAALAGALGLSLLAADLDRAPAGEELIAPLLGLLLREAHLHGALPVLHGADRLHPEERFQWLRHADGPVVLIGQSRWLPSADDPPDVVELGFALPDLPQRRQIWQRVLTAHGAGPAAAELDALAARFRLTAGQIADAVRTAAMQTQWREATAAAAPPGLGELFAAARALCGSRELDELAPKVVSEYGWDDLVLPGDQKSHLRELTDQARFRHVVLAEWGFGRKSAGGRGINALFAGPPGTGKTMAASVIANELGLDLHRVDLAHSVSKYIGETEKNLDRIFASAAGGNVVLFFDEADALFGRRSEVREAHDRYANIEVAYLLQKMEEHDGLAILATNMRQNIDEAFLRRLQVLVDFPFPDEEHRRRIWLATFPPQAPLDPDIDIARLAREVKLAGGNIRTIALAAAARAAAEGGAIMMQHLLDAARREYQKLGRSWPIAT
jgi:hypothetical protein